MGLDFNYGTSHWSYGGFGRFRIRLAEEIGIDLNSMVGFGGDVPWTTVKDDIKPLLNHSDCDGRLTVKRCSRVAPRLRELVSGWDDDDVDKIRALRLAEGMDEAISKNRPLEFI